MFEQLVRPFERPNAVATRRIVASNSKISVPSAAIAWGRAGTIPGAREIEAVDPTGLSFRVITCDDEWQEIGRKTKEERVENPDDPNVYVNVERPTEIQFWKAGEDTPNYNKTTTWQTNVETAVFSTINNNNKACKATYKLKTETEA